MFVGKRAGRPRGEVPTSQQRACSWQRRLKPSCSVGVVLANPALQRPNAPVAALALAFAAERQYP